jgi:hypothetical protein
MIRRRSIHAAAAFGALLVPFVASAQPPTASVTTAPVGQAAPALTMPLIVMIAVALTGFAMYRLRRSVGRAITGLVLVASVTAVAGLGYAIMPLITIEGANCTQETVSIFDPLNEPTELMSNCTNRIQIVDIRVLCDGKDSAPESLPDCRIGQTLGFHEACNLPFCVE